MIVLAPERGTIEYRRAHRGRISVSDARAIMARPGTQTQAKLIDRLVLDHSGVDDHGYEIPEPWQTAHDDAIKRALAAYKRVGDAQVVPCGLIGSATHSWLCASAHGLVEGGVVLFRPHASLRAFHDRGLNRAWRVRVQLTCLVCDVGWVRVCDHWDGLGRVPDKLAVKRYGFDKVWLDANVMQRLVNVWGAVTARLRTSEPASTAGPPAPASAS